nr:MAG TPA: Prokaryotic membrane lipoprotein lipid attachment site [Crassvirales sp.]
MKKLLLAILLGTLLSGCTATKYVEVPVDRVKVEYRDRISVDTLYRNDSTIIREKGDTVFLEKYKYIYRVKELKDTVNVTDTITVVNPIEVIKEVNKLHNWQVGLMILGGAAIALGGYKLIKFIKV